MLLPFAAHFAGNSHVAPPNGKGAGKSGGVGGIFGKHDCFCHSHHSGQQRSLFSLLPTHAMVP